MGSATSAPELRDGRTSDPIELDAGTLDLTALIRPGDCLTWGQGTAEPTTLTRALLDQRHAIVPEGARPLTVFLAVTKGATLGTEHLDVLRYWGIGGMGETARLTRIGAVEVMPIRLGSVCRLMREGRIRPDVVFVQLSEPVDGVCTTGVVGDQLQEAIRHARLVIGEITPHAPTTYGDTQVRLRDLDYVVRTEAPLISWPRAKQGAESQQIAEIIAGLVPDGATVQFGIGAIPEAVCDALHGHRDLGIHTGMISDPVIELVESGAVTGARKPIDAGLITTGLAFGTERLNGWVDRNESVVFRSLDHTHSQRVLGQLPDLWAINSAIEVDLTGQVNAEMMRAAYVGGLGGQLDFVGAAMSSERGRSIIAFPATAARGAVSRIVGTLDSGIVTTPRGDADLFVTEYGVADLRAATIDERIERMIAIAHPDHRDALSAQAAAARLPRTY